MTKKEFISTIKYIKNDGRCDIASLSCDDCKEHIGKICEHTFGSGMGFFEVCSIYFKEFLKKEKNIKKNLKAW